MADEFNNLKSFNPGDIVSNEEETIIAYIISQDNDQTAYKFLKHEDMRNQYLQMEYPHNEQTVKWKHYNIQKLIVEQEEIIKKAHTELAVLEGIKKAVQPKLIVGEMYQLNGSRKYALVFHKPILSRFVSIEINHSGPHNIEEKRYNLISLTKALNEGKIIHLTSDEDRAKAKAIMTIIGNGSQPA